MKQRNASSFATLRIATVLAMLWALPVGPVSAAPIQLTSGRIEPFGFIVYTFPFALWSLEGPGFSLSANVNDFSSPGAFPECPTLPCSASPTVNLSSSSMLFPGQFPDQFIYGGELYVASIARVDITTPSVVIGAEDTGLVTLPFTLQGFVQGDSPTAGSVGLGFIGGGTARATYTKQCFPTPDFCDLWRLFDIQYDIEPAPIPEPTSWMLLGSGLLGYAARRRSARRNG
jgi:PEP-CTERM motif